MFRYRLSKVYYSNSLMKGTRYLSDNKTFHFYPNYRLLEKLPGVFSAEQIQNEQRFYAASPYFARVHGGPIMSSFLDAIPKEYLERTSELGLFNKIDCRIHYLEPGDYPAELGWHCDGLYRVNNVSHADNNQIHANDFILCTFSDNTHGVSNTQFLTNKFTLFGKNYRFDDTHVWDDLNKAIEEKQPDVYTNNDGQMIKFDVTTPHRAQQATRPGWRMFVRMSMWSNVSLGDDGQLISTSKVYRELPMAP
ncbi:MAG: hypothetical protein K0U37_00045 [Gammaproteobacteria bacterium]|nr:hypothetical protein [Gammaproteobacteria bacterium]